MGRHPFSRRQMDASGVREVRCSVSRDDGLRWRLSFWFFFGLVCSVCFGIFWVFSSANCLLPVRSRHGRCRNSAVYKAKKFDIRVWSLLVSIRPLRIVTLSYGFPKVSTVDYDPSPEQFENMCMHIKMPLGPGCDPRGECKRVVKNESP